MKRILVATVLVLVISLLAVGPVAAQKGKLNIKGEVKAVTASTLTILSNKGETFTVTVLEGFDTSTIHEGDSVLVKAVAADGGGWLAQSIKLVGNNNGNDDKNDADENEDEDENGNEIEPDNDDAEGSKDNGAYCADGKQEKPHPLAARLAERYGVTEDWVMDHFCDGYGMGAIMLALKTSQIEGVDTDPDTLLSGRANGVGWGNLWKDLRLIGNEKDGHSPPGLLKKPDKKNK